jgi:hypothetical protein
MAEQLLATEASGDHWHLVQRVTDEIHVDIAPFEGQPLLAVGRIGISHREPAERSPVLRRDFLRLDANRVDRHLSSSTALVPGPTEPHRRPVGAGADVSRFGTNIGH